MDRPYTRDKTSWPREIFGPGAVEREVRVGGSLEACEGGEGAKESASHTCEACWCEEEKWTGSW